LNGTVAGQKRKEGGVSTKKALVFELKKGVHIGIILRWATDFVVVVASIGKTFKTELDSVWITDHLFWCEVE
jgi:hypothetical protein